MDIMEDFNRTVDHIDAILGESADDREIRHLSGYSRAMFSRVLSIFTGMTLSEYIRGRRLAEAAFDLRSSGKRVVDVALRHGFGSPDSFAAASKEFHGRTPPPRSGTGGPFGPCPNCGWRSASGKEKR